MKRAVSLTVNGAPVQADVEPRTHLADFLRESHHLTGTHLGCEHGVCGACTVELDGVPVRGCIAFAAACDGASVRTIEGFEDDPVMAALRAAFSRHHALQCGYCTPGMLITAQDIVRRLPDADDARIREELSGNLCRCTGYVGIVAAIREVLEGADFAAPPGAGRPAPAPRTASLPRAGTRTQTAASAPGAGNAHRVTVDATPAEVWTVLRDPATAVRCMPGAEILGDPAARPLAFRMTAAVGPMRAAFEGHADVDYDDAAMSGRLQGEGTDPRSRSGARGRVDFRVSPAATGSTLEVELDYTLSGPLAQFSRGAVVDAVVEQLVSRFARNLAAAAAGEQLGEAPAGGLGLMLSAIVARLRRWLSS